MTKKIKLTVIFDKPAYTDLQMAYDYIKEIQLSMLSGLGKSYWMSSKVYLIIRFLFQSHYFTQLLIQRF
jgi:hypothetical protein